MKRECWAAFKGDCDGLLTGEHIVSESVLWKELDVKGFHWCIDEPVKIGPSSLTANCLCKKHNNGLSHLDSAAKVAKEAMHWLRDEMASPSKYRFDLKRIDGTLLAKWCAKTACNVAVVQNRNAPRSIAEFALNTDDDPSIYVYFVFDLIGTEEFKEKAIGACWAWNETDHDLSMAIVEFFGLRVIVSPVSLDGNMDTVMNMFRYSPSSYQPMQRMKEMNANVDVPSRRHARKGKTIPGVRTIRFDWGDR